MKKLLPLLLLLLFPLAGCASHDDQSDTTSTHQKHKNDEDDDSFFNGRWLHTDDDQGSTAPTGIAGPPTGLGGSN